MDDNLPDGCKWNDIPGNRPKDVAYDEFLADELYVPTCEECETLNICKMGKHGDLENCWQVQRAFDNWYEERNVSIYDD